MHKTLRNILDGVRTIRLFPEDNPELSVPVMAGRTDAEALASDWAAIGRDFRKAMGSIDDEIRQTRP